MLTSNYNFVKISTCIIIILYLCIQPAKSENISLDDIEGGWFNAKSDSEQNNCNQFAENGNIIEGSGIYIKNNIVELYENSCKIYRKVIREREIIMYANCAQEGDQVKSLFSFSRDGEMLVFKGYSSVVGRKETTNYEEHYIRANCSNVISNQSKTTNVDVSNCSRGEATFRAKPFEDGRIIEVQFYNSASAGPAMLRGFDAQGNLEWSVQAEYSCSNGLSLCWLSLATKNNKPDTDTNTCGIEVINVNSNKNAADGMYHDIVVLAGIPQYFRFTDASNVDVKFSPTVSTPNSIYVPEVYYRYKCK